MKLLSIPRRAAGFVVAVARRFYDDQGLVRASALAYTSLLSMVPLLAVMFAVLKGLGVQERLEGMLVSRLSLSPEVTDTIIEAIARVNVGTLGGLGAAMLLVAVIGVLGAVESSFNEIWRVERARSVWRKMTDYLGVVLLTPFLLLAAVALTSTMQQGPMLRWLLESDLVSGAVMSTLQLAPIAINVAAIAVLYLVMPNRRPSFTSVALGAVFAGTAWHLAQLTYIQFQIGVANYSAIYGALSQLPITLVWLYVSWAVVLLGAEIAAVHEFGWDHLDAAPGRFSRAAVALHVLVRAADAFADGSGGVDPVRVARELGVPVEVVNEAVGLLQKRGWLLDVEGEPRFALAVEPRRVDLGALGALQTGETAPRGCDARVRATLDSLAAEAREPWSRRTLADVLCRSA